MYRGGTYRTFEVTDSQNRVWKVMSDSSVRTTNGGDQCEFVTPILRYTADMEQLQEIVRALYKAGGRANPSCGLHVHVGARGFSAATLRNLANIVYSKQDLLYKAIGVEDNADRIRYCKKLQQGFIARINAKPPKTVEEFGRQWYLDFGGLEQNRNIHYSNGRYFCVNFHAFYSKGTIEFRCFSSTLHAGYVRTYVILTIAIINQALKQRCARPKVTETDNPAFTFRTWLLRMGMIGDLYETPRKLLLKNFDGSKAWRYR